MKKKFQSLNIKINHNFLLKNHMKTKKKKKKINKKKKKNLLKMNQHMYSHIL